MLFKKKNHIKYKLEIHGMRCVMCESHINDILRKNFKDIKVKSNHFKNETIIYSKQYLDEEKIKEVIMSTGYELKKIEVERDI